MSLALEDSLAEQLRGARLVQHLGRFVLLLRRIQAQQIVRAPELRKDREALWVVLDLEGGWGLLLVFLEPDQAFLRDGRV